MLFFIVKKQKTPPLPTSTYSLMGNGGVIICSEYSGRQAGVGRIPYIAHIATAADHESRGYSIVLVAKRIGDTVPVVMRTYAHLYPNKQQELVSRLETLSTSSSSKDESDLMPLV